MKSNAIVLTGGYLHTNHAKTAHGLIRGSDRFRTRAIIDSVSAGRDAGEDVEGKPCGIPVFASLQDYFSQGNVDARYCIIAGAIKVGGIPSELPQSLREALLGRLGSV